MKRCSICKQNKSLAEFSKCKTSRDNLDYGCKECRNAYYAANRDRKLARQKELNSQQSLTPQEKERRRALRRIYDRKKARDPMFRLGVNLRGNMYHALKAMKGFRRWRDLVGYGVEELAAHLENKFTEGISWDNYGSEWHVDHVVPKSWFKYTSTDDPKFKECWALSNLQPKRKRDNQSKGNRFVG